MTSQPSREDLEKILSHWMPWGEVVKFMRSLDLYALHRIHAALGKEAPEPPAPVDRRKYKCRICQLPKPAADFPEVKRENPRLAVPCSYCASKTGWRNSDLH